MPKQKIYRIVGDTLWSLLIAGIIFLLFSGMQMRRQTNCQAVGVNIAEVAGKVFIDENEVKQIIASMAGGNLNRPLAALNLRTIEARLRKEVWIEDAQLYVDNKGNLHVHITERVPVARVFDVTGQSFYLDSAGTQLPISGTDRAEVPVFTGMPAKNKNNSNTYKRLIADILKVAAAIAADEFWMLQAGQIDVLAGGKFEMYPAVGTQVIELGTADDITYKLQRLKLFYQQILANKPVNEYSKLSVAYKNQIVAVRGTDSLHNADALRALHVFNQLVDQNRQEVNAMAVESDKGQQGRIVQENEPARQQAPVRGSPPPDNMPKAVMPANNNNN
jgi:cell division protein FtsQ